MDHERTQEKEFNQNRPVVYVLLIDVMWLCTYYGIYGKYGSQWPGCGKSGHRKGRRYGSAWRYAGWDLYGNGWCAGFRYGENDGHGWKGIHTCTGRSEFR